MTKAVIVRTAHRITSTSRSSVRRRESCIASYSGEALRIEFLRPTAILKGEQPAELTASRLARWKNLPLDWVEQRKVLGFA